MNINKNFDDFVNKKTEQTKSKSQLDFFDKMLDEAFDAEFQLNKIYDALGKDFVLALVENTKRARAKHPVFATCEEEKFKILQEEFEEVREAFYVPQDVASHAVGAQQFSHKLQATASVSQDVIPSVALSETPERTREELLDVGTVLARWYGNE